MEQKTTEKILTIINTSGFNMFTLYEYAAVKYYLGDTEYKFWEVREMFKKIVILKQTEYKHNEPKHLPFLEDMLMEVFSKHVEPQMRKRFRTLVGFLKTSMFNFEEYDFEDWDAVKGHIEEQLFMRFEDIYGFDWAPLNQEKEEEQDEQ